MFDITLLDVAHFAVFLLKGLAMVGLFAGVPVALDWIVTDLSGEHIIPLVLAALVSIKLFFIYRARSRTYRGRHKMPMTMARAADRAEREINRVKKRAQREIDRVWLEADWMNIKFDFNRDRVDWNWL